MSLNIINGVKYVSISPTYAIRGKKLFQTRVFKSEVHHKILVICPSPARDLMHAEGGSQIGVSLARQGI